MASEPRPAVPNLCPASGISYDFRFAYGNLSNYLDRIAAGESARARFLAKRSFLHRAIPRYEQYFDPGKYDRVVNRDNEAVIASVNEVVDRLNACREGGATDYQKLSPLRARLDALVSGDVSTLPAE